jgi:hypothetical protein
MSNDDDPCQSIVDAIDGLRQALLDLRAELQDAPGPARSIIMGLMRNTQLRIVQEEQVLQRCRKNPPAPQPAPLVVTFAGNATVRTDNTDAAGPFTGAFAVAITFSHDHTIFLLSGFSTTVGGISIRQTSGGRGTFNPPTGETELEIGLTLGLPIGGDASLNFFEPHQLTTERAQQSGPFGPTGSRLNRETGEISLAGASAISDNIFADGTNVEAVLLGTLTPLP